MAMLFMDSVDHYNTALILEKWTSVVDSTRAYPTSTAAYVRNGTQGFAMVWYATYFGGQNLQKRNLTVSGTTVMAGFAWKPVVVRSSTDNYILQFLSGTSAQFNVGVSPTTYDFYLHNGTSVLDRGGSWSQGNWYYVECKVDVDNSAGSATLRIDGEEVIAVTGSDTQALATNIVDGFSLVQGPGTTNNWSDVAFDDIIFMDTSGSENNDFLGDVEVRLLSPNASGTYAQFSYTGSATNWQCVDESPPNETDYVYTTGAGNIDSYNYEDITGTGNIAAIQVMTYAKRDAGGTRDIAAFVRSGGTDASGTQYTLGTSYEYDFTIFQTDPTDDAIWTISKVNAAEFGAKVEL